MTQARPTKTAPRPTRRRRSNGTLPKGRVETFSDGVFAIIVTLLAFQLRAPTDLGEDVAGALRHEYHLLLPRLLSYALAFIFVTIWWLSHHHFFHNLRRVDRGLAWLNALFLMFLCVLPIPTALLGSYPWVPLAVVPFGLVSVACGTINAGMRWYAWRAGLWMPTVTDGQKGHAVRRSLAGPILYAAAVAAAAVDVKITWAIYFIVPTIYIIPSRFETMGGEEEEEKNF